MIVQAYREAANNKSQEEKVKCWSETDELKEVLICSPSLTDIRDTNDLLLNGFNQFTTYEKLHDCYLELHQTLTENNVNVHNLANFIHPHEKENFNNCINRIFVRDVGGVVGNKFIIGKAALPAREQEFDISCSTLSKIFKNNIKKIENIVEFGDLMIVNSNFLILNYGLRTKVKSIEDILNISISQGFSVLMVLNIPYYYNRIHLDLMLNMIKEGTFIADRRLALLKVTLYVQGKKKTIDTFHNILKYLRIKVYWINTQKYFSFNFLNINTDTIIISSNHSDEIFNIMKENKIRLIKINSIELEKAGGSVRCATLPLCREP